MGFEILFNYYEKNQDGKGFNTEERKTFRRVLGKMEDVPLAKLAQCVLKEYARRDILVDEVEINEYAKKPISFREVKGGVVIKGQKFSLDDDFEVAAEQPAMIPSPALPAPQEPLVNPPSLLRDRLLGRPPAQTHVTASSGANQEILSQIKPALRMEVFSPDDPATVGELLAKGVKLTIGKKYPVYEEKSTTLMVNFGQGPQETVGYNYVVMDDTARHVEVSSIYFTPPQRPLVGMDSPEVQVQLRQTGQQSRPKLMYMGDKGNDMPQLRRSAR